MIFQLKNPTPISWIRANNFTIDQHINDVINGLRQNPPRYIIWDGLWNDPTLKNAPDFHLEPLIDFLNSNYQLTERLNDYSDYKNETEYVVEIWELKQ